MRSWSSGTAFSYGFSHGWSQAPDISPALAAGQQEQPQVVAPQTPGDHPQMERWEEESKHFTLD